MTFQHWPRPQTSPVLLRVHVPRVVCEHERLFCLQICLLCGFDNGCHSLPPFKLPGFGLVLLIPFNLTWGVYSPKLIRWFLWTLDATELPIWFWILSEYLIRIFAYLFDECFYMARLIRTWYFIKFFVLKSFCFKNWSSDFRYVQPK